MIKISLEIKSQGDFNNSTDSRNVHRLYLFVPTIQITMFQIECRNLCFLRKKKKN